MLQKKTEIYNAMHLSQRSLKFNGYQLLLTITKKCLSLMKVFRVKKYYLPLTQYFALMKLFTLSKYIYCE